MTAIPSYLALLNNLLKLRVAGVLLSNPNAVKDQFLAVNSCFKYRLNDF